VACTTAAARIATTKTSTLRVEHEVLSDEELRRSALNQYHELRQRTKIFEESLNRLLRTGGGLYHWT
jgi:hypothetical protein